MLTNEQVTQRMDDRRMRVGRTIAMMTALAFSWFFFDAAFSGIGWLSALCGSLLGLVGAGLVVVLALGWRVGA